MSEATATLGGSAQESLRSYVERYERLEDEVKGIREDQKELMAAAKAEGFDVKILKQCIRIRKLDANDRLEQEALLDIYMHALEGGERILPNAGASPKDD